MWHPCQFKEHGIVWEKGKLEVNDVEYQDYIDRIRESFIQCRYRASIITQCKIKVHSWPRSMCTRVYTNIMKHDLVKLYIPVQYSRRCPLHRKR